MAKHIRLWWQRHVRNGILMARREGILAIFLALFSITISLFFGVVALASITKPLMLPWYSWLLAALGAIILSLAFGQFISYSIKWGQVQNIKRWGQLVEKSIAVYFELPWWKNVLRLNIPPRLEGVRAKVKFVYPDGFEWTVDGFWKDIEPKQMEISIFRPDTRHLSLCENNRLNDQVMPEERRELPENYQCHIFLRYGTIRTFHHHHFEV